jgi:hypothetical protein
LSLAVASVAMANTVEVWLPKKERRRRVPRLLADQPKKTAARATSQ